VIVRDAVAMRETFSLVPPYLRTDGKPEGVWGLPWFSEFGFQQTRGFRALKVWMALQYHGISGYRAAIEHDMQLAERLAAAVRNDPDFELHEPQSLSIVCFRYSPSNVRDDAEALDSLNKSLLEKTQLSGEAFLSSTVMDGRFWLRACIINPRAAEADIDRLVETLREIGGAMVRN